MDRLWRSNSSISSRTGCPLDIVNDEDHNVEKHGASVLMCLHDAKSKNSKNNISCMANVSLNDHVYFNHYSKASCPYSKIASKEEDGGKFVDFNFSPIDNFDYVKQLRVLTVLNEDFKVNLIPLYDEFILSKNRTKRKYFQDNFAQSEKDRVKRKWLDKMNQLKKHILFFDFLENHYVSNDEVSKQHLSVIRKSNVVKATPFKISDDPTPITSLIEQNNFTNESLHVIGQQPDRIEEKIVENTISVKKSASGKSIFEEIEKPFIDLSGQREKVMFKTSQSKMLEVVDKMLSDLNVKTEGTSRSTTCTISKNEKEIVSDEHTDSNTVSFVSAKKIFDNDLPEIKRFVGNPKLMSFTKNWYSKPTLPNM